MARGLSIGDVRDRPGGGKRQRKGGASPSILVQIQAGSPTFARFAGWASPALAESFGTNPQMPVDGPLKALSRLRNLV